MKTLALTLTLVLLWSVLGNLLGMTIWVDKIEKRLKGKSIDANRFVSALLANTFVSSIGATVSIVALTDARGIAVLWLAIASFVYVLLAPWLTARLWMRHKYKKLE